MAEKTAQDSGQTTTSSSSLSSSSSPQYWFVKLPQFVLDDFSARLQTPSAPIGHIIFDPTDKADKPNIKLVYQPSDSRHPSEFTVATRPVQSTLIFSEPPAAKGAAPTFLGPLTVAADVNPVDTPEYRALLRERLMAKMSGGRAVKRYEESGAMASTPALVKAQQAQMAKRKIDNKEEPTEKRVRSDRVEAEAKVLQAFNGKQYLNMKELLDFTQEPKHWLMTIVGDLCSRETKGPNANYYQLKEKYRIA